MWQSIAPTPAWSYAVDMARHALVPGVTVDGAAPAYYVDTFGLGFDGTFGNGSDCQLNGFYSTGPQATGTPAWSLNLPLCTTDSEQDGMGAYVSLQASDDGSVVAFLAYIKDSAAANATAHAVVVNGQTGVVKFMYELKGLPVSQGQISVTPDGSFVFLLMEDNVNGGEKNRVA